MCCFAGIIFLIVVAALWRALLLAAVSVPENGVKLACWSTSQSRASDLRIHFCCLTLGQSASRCSCLCFQKCHCVDLNAFKSCYAKSNTKTKWNSIHLWEWRRSLTFMNLFRSERPSWGASSMYLGGRGGAQEASVCLSCGPGSPFACFPSPYELVSWVTHVLEVWPVG